MSPRGIAVALAFVVLATVPCWLPGTYYINVSSQILFYAIFALGLNILVGYAGLVSLGHAGLFGIAAYTTAYLLSTGVPHTAAIVAALTIGLASTALYSIDRSLFQLAAPGGRDRRLVRPGLAVAIAPDGVARAA